MTPETIVKILETIWSLTISNFWNVLWIALYILIGIAAFAGLLGVLIPIVATPSIAYSKGRNAWGWFFAGLATSWVGVILISVLHPNEKKLAEKPKRQKLSGWRRTFLILNTALLIAFALLCLAPFMNLLATSLSDSEAVDAGKVALLPVGFTVDAYKVLVTKIAFFRAFGVSVLRVVLGTLISVGVITLGAYPLSRGGDVFKGRMFYIVIFIVTMFFTGGLVPTYIIITKLGLYNNVLALILPTAMNAWNMVLLINFFRQVPKELEEAAKLEGAGHYRILLQIVLPVSLPALATVILFTAVQHWNNWFDGLIYMSPNWFPLQTYIYNMVNEANILRQQLIASPGDANLLAQIPAKTLESAQIFIAILPIIPLYPFAQRFFIKGLVLGSVKE